jgi:hypothetical protein
MRNRRIPPSKSRTSSKPPSLPFKMKPSLKSVFATTRLVHPITIERTVFQQPYRFPQLERRQTFLPEYSPPWPRHASFDTQRSATLWWVTKSLVLRRRIDTTRQQIQTAAEGERMPVPQASDVARDEVEITLMDNVIVPGPDHRDFEDKTSKDEPPRDSDWYKKTRLAAREAVSKRLFRRLTTLMLEAAAKDRNHLY